MPKISPEEQEKRSLEAAKLEYDAFKHLTTLSSGAVVVIAALMDKAFPGAAWKWLAGASAVAFLVSCFFSVIMMLYAAYTAENADPKNGLSVIVVVAFATAAICFLGGVAALASFILINSL